ncbi:MAG: Ig-like domain-containing protein [SAR324 cluster bacterium]|nr:Ig-like domain-containing protein [SAR324 cluster bacterium]
MDDNDTIKTFNSCANRITGCQVPFQIVSTDFAGNQSTHNQTGTTDNSTVKFDGINPDLTSVNFSTDNCNVRAGKVGDRQTLIATASEPLLQSSVLVHFLSDNGSHQDNFTAPSQISLNFSGTSGDLTSRHQLSADRVFTSTDVEGPISFYSYFTDPAGNSNENLNTTTDTSSVTFDRSIPKLNNISVSTDNDPGFDNHSMPGTKINVIFKANEELRALNNNYCTNNCCINPYVVRRYCDNSSIDCTDNVSTDPTKNSYADQEHTVDSGHTDWTNGFRHYSTDTTSLNGDSFYFEIHYLDWAGNPGVIRYTPDDNKTITYDDVRPTLAEVLVKSNNWNTNVKYVAKTGDNITLTYTLPANLRSPPPSVGVAQRTTSSYNSITPTSLGSNRYEAIYTMTDNDIEGRVDFEIVFKDIAGNQEIVRMDRKHTNNCKVPSPLLISPVGTLCNSWSNDNLTHNLVMETGTTDGSFVVFDRTPPSMLLTPIADEKSVIDEIVKLRFHDLTGLLSTTSSVYTGYDNFSGSSFYPSGPTDNMSTVYCNTPIELTDNRSNFTDCYPIFRVGKSNGNPSDNRTKALADIPIRWQSYDCCDTPRGKTTNNYRQSFEVVRNDLQTAECPIRPSQPCRANLFPNSLIKAKLRTNISDLAGNILNPLEVGGDNITESFETYRRPFVRSHTPSDNETGVSVNINPTLTFNIPQTNNTSNDNINKKWEKNYNSSESDTPRGNVNLDPDCLITDNHTSGTKGSISIDPSPNSGFTLGYLSSSTSGFNTITLRPSGPLDSGTIYTVTVQNDVHPGPSFCRYTEKIAPLNRFQFSFKTVDNITRGLIAHYPLNNNTLDHSNIDNNVWNDGTKTAGVTTTNGRDENSNGAYDFNTGQIEIPQNASLEFDDNMSVSMWFYPDTIPTGTSETTLISKSNGNNNFQINLKSGNQIKAEWYDVSSTTVKTLTSCVVKENEWNHLVFTYEKNNKAFLYLNGEFCNSLANGGSLQNPGLDNLFIGSDSGTTYFDGAIDEVKLYNILLGPGEVRDLFVETGRNLSGYYPLGDRNAKDYSGYGYDGSVVGGVSNTSDNDGDTNQASEFNGTSGYIKIPYQNELNAENFTILSWIKPSNSSHTMEGLFSSEDTGRGYGIYKWFYTYSNRVNNNDIASQVLYTDRTNLSLTTPSERCRQRNPPNASYPFQKGTVWGVGCHDNKIDKYFEFWTGSSGASNVNNTNTLVSLRQIDADNTSSLCCTNNYIKHYNSTETAANAIRDTKLTLNGTSYYDIETVSDKWIFMVVTYDGTEKKVGLRNYFDSANSPDLTFKTKTKSESLYLRNTNATRELFIGTGRGSGINTNVNNYFYTGKMDEVRIYNRVLKDVELNAIYNTADTEPPVPGGSGNINTGISWTAAIDDHTATASLEYKVVSTANNQNRISNVESALRNGTVQMDWTANVSNHGYNTANTFVTVLVRDKAGNISSYGVRSL